MKDPQKPKLTYLSVGGDGEERLFAAHELDGSQRRQGLARRGELHLNQSKESLVKSPNLIRVLHIDLVPIQ